METAGGVTPGEGGTVEAAGGVTPGEGARPDPGGRVTLGLGDKLDADGGSAGSVCDEDRGGVGTPGASWGEGTAAICGCSVGLGSGLTAVAGISGLEVFRSSNFTAAVATPTVTSAIAAILAQKGGVLAKAGRLRVGNISNSALYSSSAVAKSNNCSKLR